MQMGIQHLQSGMHNQKHLQQPDTRNDIGFMEHDVENQIMKT